MKKVVLSQAKQDLVDARFSRLLGNGGIGRQDKTIFLKKSTMFTSDWQHYLEYCDPYVFHNVLPAGAIWKHVFPAHRCVPHYTEFQMQRAAVRRQCKGNGTLVGV
jgi:hypothetical protein